MKRVLYLLVGMFMISLAACDVHEWPNLPERVAFHLRLHYETEMTEWHHFYNDVEVVEQGLGESYDNHLKTGQIRYVIRAYPSMEKLRSVADYTQEFVFTKDIAAGYDHEVTLDLPAGSYDIMVWSDLMQFRSDNPFHDATNFAEIRLQGDHVGNSDYRDAFRGTNHITLVSDYVERLPDTLDITMQRPLAKFEFVTNDVDEFIVKEQTRLEAKSRAEGIQEPNTRVVLEDYRVVFYYIGFMPDTYSMLTDKPVDSATGMQFETTLRHLSDTEASMGFDYIFVNGSETITTLQVGIYDKEGTQLSLTEPLSVPLRRNRHTILKGMFLMTEASGGVTINPDYEGDHNIIIP